MKNYKEFIDTILNTRGRFNCGDKYHERHHIIPKCIGGSDDEENLIDLYAKEHFEAHRLLALEHSDNKKLICAWWMMSHIKDKNQDRYKLSADEYEEVRIAHSNSMKERVITQETRDKLREINLGHKVSEETRKKISDKAKARFASPAYTHPLLGRTLSEETRKKLSEANKGVQAGENHPLFGKHHSDETKQKIGQKAKKRLSNPENHPMYGKTEGKNPRAIAIEQYDQFGNFITIWSCAKEAANSLHIDPSGITKCCKGKYKTVGGYVWKYADDDKMMSNNCCRG